MGIPFCCLHKCIPFSSRSNACVLYIVIIVEFCFVFTHKAQDYLISLDAKNMEILDVINKALIVCVLDDAEPVSNSEVCFDI